MLYILDADGNPQPCEDLAAWQEWGERDERRMIRQQRWVRDDGSEVCVLTMFGGVDCGFVASPTTPALWGSMATVDRHLPGEGNACVGSKVYTSPEAAVIGHRRMVQKLGGVDI